MHVISCNFMTFDHKSDSFFAVSQKRKSVSKSTSVENMKTRRNVNLEDRSDPGKNAGHPHYYRCTECTAIAAICPGSHAHVMLPPNSRET